MRFGVAVRGGGWARRCAWLVAGVCSVLSACGSGAGADQATQGRAPTFVPVNSSGSAGAGGAKDDRGVLLGRFVHTFYWMEFESDYPGRADTELAGSDCHALATVPEAFADRICVEGSGRLASGALLNLSGECDCGTACPETGASVCFFPIAETRALWGYGSAGNPLVPLRSLAIEQSVVPHGTVLYIPEWDGLAIPASPHGIGGFVHDGCFKVDDVGYGVEGRHYDFYAGTSALWMALEQLMPTASSTTVYRDPARCAGKQL
jgi:3D (Asp-Asp-Asp) domain-containing protein